MKQPSFMAVVLKTTSIHIVTYFILLSLLGALSAFVI